MRCHSEMIRNYKHVFVIKVCISTILCIVISSYSCDAGTWGITYNRIDSITNLILDKEVRLDFKSSNSDTLYRKGAFFFPKIKDTVSLIIDGKRIFLLKNGIDIPRVHL